MRVNLAYNNTNKSIIILLNLLNKNNLLNILYDILFSYKWNKKAKPFQRVNDQYMVKSDQHRT